MWNHTRGWASVIKTTPLNTSVSGDLDHLVGLKPVKGFEPLVGGFEDHCVYHSATRAYIYINDI